MTNQDRRNGIESDEESGIGQIETVLTDEGFEQLQALEDTLLTSLTLWEDSLAYGEEGADEVPDEERVFFDCDLYFADQQLLEVYGASLYDDPDGEPLEGMNEITEVLAQLTESGATLSEIASDAEDGLVLVFGLADESAVLMAVSGWVLDTWDELPEYEEGEDE